MDESTCPNCGSVRKIQCMEQISSKTEPMYNSREKMMNILSYVDVAKLRHVIKHFPRLNQKIGKEDITYPLLSSSRAIEWGKHILINLNQVCLKLIQELTMTS